MSLCRRFASLSVLVGWLAVASACGQPSRGDLHKAAQSLVPPGATVVLEKDGGCVEGARFPSCVVVYFRVAHRRVAERLNLFITNARRHGWKTQRTQNAGGEAGIKLRKGSYLGGAGFWLDPYFRPKPHCDPVSTTHPCADHFQIQWKGGGPIQG